MLSKNDKKTCIMLCQIAKSHISVNVDELFLLMCLGRHIKFYNIFALRMNDLKKKLN